MSAKDLLNILDKTYSKLLKNSSEVRKILNRNTTVVSITKENSYTQVYALARNLGFTNPQSDFRVKNIAEKFHNASVKRFQQYKPTKGVSKSKAKAIPGGVAFTFRATPARSADVFNRIKRVLLKDYEITAKELLLLRGETEKSANRIVKEKRKAGQLGHTGHLEAVVSLQTQDALKGLNKSGIDMAQVLSDAADANVISSEHVETFLRHLDCSTTFGKHGTIKTAKVNVQIEHFTINLAQSGQEKREKDQVLKIAEALREAIRKENLDWWTLETSSSTKTIITETIKKTAIKAGGKGTTKKLDTKNSKGRSTVSHKNKSRVVAPTVKQSNKKPKRKKAIASFASLPALLNEKLAETIKSHMNSPALVNRTGRFAESVVVIDAIATNRGFPSIGYTYMKNPYVVFEPSLGKAPWNTPQRDPKALIDLSIRDIARELGIGRLYTRRL